MIVERAVVAITIMFNALVTVHAWVLVKCHQVLLPAECLCFCGHTLAIPDWTTKPRDNLPPGFLVAGQKFKFGDTFGSGTRDALPQVVN